MAIAAPSPVAQERVNQATDSSAEGAGRLARVGSAIAGVALLLVYTALNAARLGEQSFWTDELFSVSQANLDPIPMLKLQAADNHPPFYAMVLWAWIRLTHDATEATVRLVSLLAIAAGTGILALATWRRAGIGPAVLVLTLATTSSLLASFGLEARMHGLAFGLICVASAAWIFLLGSRPLRPQILMVFVAAGGLAALTQYYAFMVYVLEAGVLGAWLVLARRRRELILSTALAGLSVLPVLAWLVATRRLLNASGTPPLTMAWADDVAATSTSPFSDALFGQAPDARHGVALVMAVALVAALVVVAGFVALRRAAGSRDAPERRRRLVLGTVTLGVAAAAVVIGSGESIVYLPTMHYRSVTGILPVLYLGLGLAFTAPFGRFATVAGAGLAALLAVVAITTPTPPLYAKDDWRAAAAIVRETREAGLPAERIVLVAPFNHREWLVELNEAYGRPAPVTDPPPQLADVTWIAAAADLAPVAANQPLLLVAFHHWRWEVHEAILAATRDRFGPCQDRGVTGITILRCDGAPAAGR